MNAVDLERAKVTKADVDGFITDNDGVFLI